MNRFSVLICIVILSLFIACYVFADPMGMGMNMGMDNNDVGGGTSAWAAYDWADDGGVAWADDGGVVWEDFN